MLRHRGFWVSLLVTAVFWLMATMSEPQNYPLKVRVDWTGYDTNRYAVSHADTVIPLTLNANCFAAISATLQAREKPFVVQTAHDTVLTLSAVAMDDVSKQFDLTGIRSISPGIENIRFSLTPLHCRAYQPQLRGVNFQFSERFGLSGKPSVSPDTIWLYGSDAALDKIAEVHTSPMAITNISDSRRYRLALDPIWKKVPGVKSSTDSVTVSVPVSEFVEKVFTLPVQVRCADKRMKIKLFPDMVTVTLLVPPSRFGEVNERMVEAVAAITPESLPAELAVCISKFPACSRVKNVSPATLQYVILKGPSEQ